VTYLSTEQKDFDGPSFGTFRKTLHLIDVEQSDIKQRPIIDYVYSIVSVKAMQQDNTKYQEYIELLRNNRNVVLTGAPGTGKTYMARAIATAMNAECKFVQFHPSYDYTDFVEGLRPVDNGSGQIGFERKDGVFKAFCREAIKNLEDSAKTVETLGKELSWQERLQQFVEDAINAETTYQTTNGSEFTIRSMNDHTITVNNEHNEKTSNIPVNADEILTLLKEEVLLNNVRDIKKFFERKYATQPDSYAFVIVNELRKVQPSKELILNQVAKVQRKDYVLIIDEINRGEASKIFGELFYAIDPGYRGVKEQCVQTQYQNLVPESDVFAKGFYVPENVYILATMNDIDRSVESMDFAMRRRFTWQEILPSDTDYMLDSLDTATEAKQRMNSLNQAIANTENLGVAYMIGPSYFLKLKDYGGDFGKLWRLNIEPLLKEYLRGFRGVADLMKQFESAYTMGIQTVNSVETNED
jgi:5-methylcytosine-specific restriction endonuclease McrBC GTP-binding regulatory subunit McrB